MLKILGKIKRPVLLVLHSMLIIVLFIAFATLFFFSCRSNGKVQHAEPKLKQQSTAFSLPSVPVMISGSEARNEYLAVHYWNNFTSSMWPSDSVSLHHAFADFVTLLAHVPMSVAKVGVDSLMAKVVRPILCRHTFLSWSGTYLYDPNSVLRNDELYLVFLKKAMVQSDPDSLFGGRLKDRYLMCMRNRVKHPASDFKFVFSNGKHRNLYSLHAPYVLLFFNNPGCVDCKLVFKLLKESVVINRQISSGNLLLLSVYPDDDLEEWKKEIPRVPSTWLNVYDKGAEILKKGIYDLKAIPTLYLLDSRKYVILKDADFQKVEYYLTHESLQ